MFRFVRVVVTYKNLKIVVFNTKIITIKKGLILAWILR